MPTKHHTYNKSSSKVQRIILKKNYSSEIIIVPKISRHLWVILIFIFDPYLNNKICSKFLFKYRHIYLSFDTCAQFYISRDRDMLTFSFFWKTVVLLWKRRWKIENEAIVFKNDRFFKKFVLQKWSFLKRSFR